MEKIKQKLLWAALSTYFAAWIYYVFTGTKTLRGFFGDGALAFLIYLSDTFAFNKSGHFIHIFSVGLPREAQLLLNGLSLQAALLTGLHDPQFLKYVYVFWQFALPGFLYVALFAFLWRSNKLSWAVFPLISWAVLSAPVEWNAVSGSRWALPIFWMHFFLVIFAAPQIRRWPAIGAIISGFLMWGGLYESVMMHATLCLGFGVLLWWKQQNKTPLLYALAAVPGACRTLLSVMDGSTNLPNGFHGFVLLTQYTTAYYFFILLALGLIILLGSGKFPLRYGFLLPLVLILPAVNVLSNDLPSLWQQMNMRYDCVVISLALMLWAGFLRVVGKTEIPFAPAAAFVALLTGTVLWTTQIQQTYEWAACHAHFTAEKNRNTPPFQNYIQHGSCTWDWATPWTEMLFADQGRVDKWPVLTFWQDFAFIQKDGTPYLHTNNWTLTSPSASPSEADLPLTTPLYDLRPLYQRYGTAPITKHEFCFPPEQSGSYWHDYLMALDDNKRRLMFVCPRNPSASN